MKKCFKNSYKADIKIHLLVNRLCLSTAERVQRFYNKAFHYFGSLKKGSVKNNERKISETNGCMIIASVTPACAATGQFHFEMGWGQATGYNTYGYIRKAADNDPNFYVHPKSGKWNPNYDNVHVYAINNRYQECNRNNNVNRLNGNYTHKIAYYYRSVPEHYQSMNIKIKEFQTGLHSYTIDGS